MTQKQIGRPFSPEITEGLLELAEEVMEDQGFSGLKVDPLVKRIGSTRAAFYRRFPNASHLAFEVVVRRFGRPEEVDTGSLARDLVEMQYECVELFTSPLMRNSLPGMLDSISTDATLARRYREYFVMPRRIGVGKAVERAVARGELNAAVQYDLDELCDVMLGPVLTRLILPLDLPLDRRLAEWTAEEALLYLRRHSEAG